MTGEHEGSVTRWIEALRDENRIDEATRQLWQRYFERLVVLARGRLRSARRGPGDEEDVALSAFNSLCRGVSAGRFAALDSRDGLWRLLATITSCKAINQLKRESSQRRGGGRVMGEAALAAALEGGPARLDDFANREPTPEFAAIVADECRRLFDLLRDDTLREVALLKMEGYANEEIAAHLGRGLRTVERKLEVIRKQWSSELPS